MLHIAKDTLALTWRFDRDTEVLTVTDLIACYVERSRTTNIMHSDTEEIQYGTFEFEDEIA
jgi:hypothetical protein